MPASSLADDLLGMLERVRHDDLTLAFSLTLGRARALTFTHNSLPTTGSSRTTYDVLRTTYYLRSVEDSQSAWRGQNYH